MIAGLLHKISRRFSCPTVVLMYHRIAIAGTDPWGLCVSAQHFEEQLQVLQKFNVVPVTGLLKSVANKQRSICLTFDDGYADNYLVAKPLLEKYGCPATFFIPSAYIQSQQPFWWDALENILLHSPALPSSLTVTIGENVVAMDGIETTLTPGIIQQHQHWRWPEAPPTKRCAVYLAVWKALQPLPLTEINICLAAIESWSGNKVVTDALQLPMTVQELQALAHHPLIDIGVHTATHPALAQHTKQFQATEIMECRNYLQAVCNRPITTIAYPYGSYNGDTLLVAQEHGFTTGFTTAASAVNKESDPLALGRFAVPDVNGDAFEKRLREWMG